MHSSLFLFAEEEEDETRGGTAEPRPIYTLAESGV